MRVAAAYDRGVECTPALAATFRDAGVAAAWVFGSRVAGGAGPTSDVDVAVLSAADRPPLSLLQVSRLERRLDGLLPGRPDVTVFERAPLELRARIVLTGQVLFSDDEPLRVRTTVDVQSRWEDVRPAVLAMDRAYLRAVAARAVGG
jgi:predicted nucleotidyltransferase